jgi:uncharacterized BrkB/YihY/UPF0761 family membrane protein
MIAAGTRWDRTLSYLARHRAVEAGVYVLLGMAGFFAFVLPLLVFCAWAGDNEVALPFIGPDWMFYPNVALRVVVLFGPSLLGMCLLYGAMRRHLELPVRRLRLSGIGA